VSESSAGRDNGLSAERRRELHGALRGFYAILDRNDRGLAELLVTAAGARVLQVRIKPGTAAEILDVARMARAITRAHGALLVVNDRLDIALAVEADAVHLGQDDLALADARRVAQGRLAIGISTHNRGQVLAAVAGGADYLGFGPVYATGTKENPDPVQGVNGLRDAVAMSAGVPIIAIGGITAARCEEVAETGAAGAAAIAAVNAAPDPSAAGRAIATWWRDAPQS
jgi:thiamine-phosphate pyrophosphorylase